VDWLNIQLIWLSVIFTLLFVTKRLFYKRSTSSETADSPDKSILSTAGKEFQEIANTMEESGNDIKTKTFYHLRLILLSRPVSNFATLT
jgi:hypothetical protein